MSIIGRNSKNIPPTVGTLVPHVFRAYYSALLSKAAVALLSEIPPPNDYYWVSEVLCSLLRNFSENRSFAKHLKIVYY